VVRIETVEQFNQALDDAKAVAKARYDKLVAKAKAAHEAGLYDAQMTYEDEVAGLDGLRDRLLATLFGGGEGLLSSSLPIPVGPLRPPTWRDAVLTVLKGGSPAGTHVKDIWAAVQRMGVSTHGERSGADPLLMVDNTLHRLVPVVKRVGRRRWALNPDYTPSSSSENSR